MQELPPQGVSELGVSNTHYSTLNSWWYCMSQCLYTLVYDFIAPSLYIFVQILPKLFDGFFTVMRAKSEP